MCEISLVIFTQIFQMLLCFILLSQTSTNLFSFFLNELYQDIVHFHKNMKHWHFLLIFKINWADFNLTVHNKLAINALKFEDLFQNVTTEKRRKGEEKSNWKWIDNPLISLLIQIAFPVFHSLIRNQLSYNEDSLHQKLITCFERPTYNHST